MPTLLQSLGSLNDLSAYLAAAWAPYKVDGQMPVDDWDCTFSNPNWTTCLFTSWRLPLLLGFLATVKGLFVQSISHWGFYATIGTPETHDGYTTGIYNVYTAWYTLDAQIGAVITFMEVLFLSLGTLISGLQIIAFNNAAKNMYMYFGYIQVAMSWISISNQAVIMAYNVINAVYLQSRYDPTNWVTIEFPTFFNQFGQDDTFLSMVVYLEQIFVGNKRLALYNNFLMAGALMLHPITLPFSFYYMAQLPFQFVLDIFVYPFYPQFDTPQLPWHEYFNANSDLLAPNN